MEDNDDISDDGKNLWSSLLQEVKEKSSKTRHIPNSLLVLGNELSGKSSLIARLQKADSKNGVGLEFEFIDVKDESMDENKQLNVWISSGDTFHSNLLKYALDENNFEFTLCMITVSFSEPWAIIESLEQWLDILKKHIDRLKLEPHTLVSLKESLSRHFQEYVEPEISDVAAVIVGKRRDADFNHLHPIVTDEPDKICVPLGDGVFNKNLGIPIIVVITKTDQISTLEEQYQFDDDKFDFIQMNIRKLCLKYGAALCYTSLKDGRNCEMLLGYILHRCYGFPFIDTASVIEKDAIFIPAGWDNTNKINILADNLPEDKRNQNFDAFITKPLSLVKAAAQTRLSEPEMSEDEQVFLMRQQAQLQRIKASIDPNIKPDPSRGGQLPKGSSVASSGPGRNRKNISGQSSVGVNNANPSAQGNEGVLANFFSSLLNKRAVPGEQSLQSQQSTTEDQGKQTENAFETDKVLKEDLKSEDIPDTITTIVEEKSSPAHIPTTETNLQRLEEEMVDESSVRADELPLDDVTVVTENIIEDEVVAKENIIEEDSEKREHLDDDLVMQDGDEEHNNEALKSEETETDDENSTGKQISELENNMEVREESVNELKMDEENVKENNLDNDKQNQEVVEKLTTSEIGDGIDNLERKMSIDKSENDSTNFEMNDNSLDIDRVHSTETKITDSENIVQENVQEMSEMIKEDNDLCQTEEEISSNADLLKDTLSEEHCGTKEDLDASLSINAMELQPTNKVESVETSDSPMGMDKLDSAETNAENSMDIVDNNILDYEAKDDNLKDTVGNIEDDGLCQTNDGESNTSMLPDELSKEQCPQNMGDASSFTDGAVEIETEIKEDGAEINKNHLIVDEESAIETEVITQMVNNCTEDLSVSNDKENDLDRLEENQSIEIGANAEDVGIPDENVINDNENNSLKTEAIEKEDSSNVIIDDNDKCEIVETVHTESLFSDGSNIENIEDIASKVDNFHEKINVQQADNKETDVSTNIENESVAGDDSKIIEDQKEQT